MFTNMKSDVDEDGDQSRRFREAVRELEAAGKLNPTGDVFERLLAETLKPRRRSRKVDAERDRSPSKSR